MDYIDAVPSQPDALVVSRRHVTAALAGLDLTAWRTGSIALVAMGASSHAGQAFAHRMRAAGRRVCTVDAAEITGYGPKADLADSYLLISEGGRSRETIEAAAVLGGRPRLALTNVPTAPLGSVVDAVIGLGHGEDSKVYTVGYTATVQALGLLAEELAGRSDGDDWDALPGVVADLLSGCRPQITDVAEALAGVDVIDVVGSGVAVSAVLEAALMLREGPRMSAAGFQTHQYLHGPIESQRAGAACLLLGGQRETELSQFTARRNVTTVLITSEQEATEITTEPNLHVIGIPALAPFSTAVAHMIPVQLLVAELAAARGVNLDEFLYDQPDTKVESPVL